jgi:hypothetical protein
MLLGPLMQFLDGIASSCLSGYSMPSSTVLCCTPTTTLHTMAGHASCSMPHKNWDLAHYLCSQVAEHESTGIMLLQTCQAWTTMK